MGPEFQTVLRIALVVLKIIVGVHLIDSIAFAELPSALEGRLRLKCAEIHQALQAEHKAIVSMQDQNMAIKRVAVSATGIMLDDRTFQIKLARVLSHLTHAGNVTYAITRAEDESPEQFTARNAEYEGLRQEIGTLILSEFPLNHAPAVGMILEQGISKAPLISAQELFSNIIISPEYEGWRVHAEEIQATRGANGYHFIDREVSAGDSSNNQTMRALADPLLGKTPLYLVNQKPVALDGSPASQSFFHGLSNDMLEEQKSEGWVGHRYIFFRDALIDTARYSDAESRKPIPLFLMKKVTPAIWTQYAINKKNQEKFEKKIHEQMQFHDLLHEALSLKAGSAAAPEERNRKVERARSLMSILAQRRVARAEYEYAMMLKDGLGGPVDLNEKKIWRESCCSRVTVVLAGIISSSRTSSIVAISRCT